MEIIHNLIPYLHEGLLEREELAELDGGGKHREGDDVGVVGVHLEGRVQRDVLITPETIFVVLRTHKCFYRWHRIKRPFITKKPLPTPLLPPTTLTSPVQVFVNTFLLEMIFGTVTKIKLLKLCW